MSKEILVPDIGDFTDVEVVEVLVSAGDTIKPEASMISLESDKAVMEIPSPEGGVVKEVKVKVGDRVSAGSLILLLEPSGGTAASAEPAKKEAPKAKPASAKGAYIRAMALSTTMGVGIKVDAAQFRP